VLIVPAKVSDFVRALDEQDSSASVMLITKNGEMLTQSEANGIIRIVLNAVAGIKPENISIVDEALNVYFMDEDGEGDETANITTQRLLEESIKRELSSQIVNLLTPVFGAGKVRAEASVTLDFDSEVSEDIVFTEPVEGMGTGLMLSMADELEIARANGAAEGVPGTDANGMGTQEDIDGTITYPYGDLEEGETYRRVFEEANYEINKKVTQLEKAKGTVKAMSIGVMVDSVAVPEDYTEQVRELVASAIGTSVDYVTVARLPFQDGALNPVVDGIQSYIDAMDQYRTQELLRTGIICATVLILVIFILMLIRSMLKKKEEPVMEAAGAGGGINYLVGGDEQYESGMYGSGEDVASVGEAKEDEEIVTVGAPPPETVVQLEKMIKSNPEAVASILRGWLTDEQ
jgi:flagellar M-ring protein FliF